MQVFYWAKAYLVLFFSGRLSRWIRNADIEATLFLRFSHLLANTYLDNANLSQERWCSPSRHFTFYYISSYTSTIECVKLPEIMLWNWKLEPSTMHRGTGLYGDLGTGPNQILLYTLTLFQSRLWRADYTHHIKFWKLSLQIPSIC